MQKVIYSLIIYFMILPKSGFAATAPTPWEKPIVNNKIYEKILYVPIADDSVAQMPIIESGEELIDLLTLNNPRIKPLATFDQMYTNTYEGYSKIRLGVYKRLLIMLDLLPNNIGIAYFEGFRPLSKQKEYFDKKFKEILEIIPDKEQAYLETTKHVSPFINNIPTHTTGAAIDMTLFIKDDVNKKEILMDMGKFDVIFGANDQQETFSKNTTDLQRENRLMLLNSAIKAGFANYGFEWWHYSYGDKMHAKVYKQKNAIYHLAAEKNDPILSIDKSTYLNSFGD